MADNFATNSRAQTNPNFHQRARVPLVSFVDDTFASLGPPSMRGAIVFSGSSHPALVDGICDRLGSKRGSVSLGKFANGETSVSIRAWRARTVERTWG